VYVRTGSLNDPTDKLSESVLVRECFFVHVERVRCWEEGKWGVMVARVTPRCVLLHHQASDGTRLNYILRDCANKLGEVATSTSLS